MDVQQINTVKQVHPLVQIAQQTLPALLSPLQFLYVAVTQELIEMETFVKVRDLKKKKKKQQTNKQTKQI